MVLLPLLFLTALNAADSTSPGEITTPYPAIAILAVEWRIEGDDSQNATCEVRYRKSIIPSGVRLASSRGADQRR